MYCVYCGLSHDEAIETSLEHVIPFALGGSDELTIVTCKRQNNELGSDVDAPFVDFFPIRAKRFFLGLESTGGNEPTLDLGGKGWIQGKEVQISYSITKDSKELKIARPSAVKNRVGDTEEWNISGDPVAVRKILKGKLRDQLEKGKTITLKNGQLLKPEDLDDLIADSKAETLDPSVLKTISFDYLMPIRFFSKMALAIGYLHLGEVFGRSAYAQKLRRAMRIDRLVEGQLPGAAIWPETSYVKPLLQQFVRPDEHTIVIFDGAPPVLLISLFGEFDAFLPLGEFPAENRPAVSGQGTIWRVNLPARQLRRISIEEHFREQRVSAGSDRAK
jgi:hypothetical protein